MALQGFTTWTPTPESEVVLGLVAQVLEDYRDHLPLTGRQIFYRLTSMGYEKSEPAAKKLYGVLARARRAGILPFDVIRDGGSKSAIPQTYDDAVGFWRVVHDRFDHYVRNRQAGQSVYVELFCEAPSMMPQLQRVAFDYGVPVYGTRGFTGLGVVADIVRRALLRDRETVLLQVGDLDPSGESIFETMAADAETFVRQVTRVMARGKENGTKLASRLGLGEDECELLGLRCDPLAFGVQPSLRTQRVALTREQQEEYDLPTAPPSGKDSRAKSWVGETCQLEAMPPDLLADTVREAIESEFDIAMYREEVGREHADREAIAAVLPPIEEEDDAGDAE